MSIQARPTEGLSYSPLDAHYYDADSLQGELERVYDICHGCRLCFKYCPTFPLLFDATDAHDGDVRKISAAESRGIVDSCYQCKLCYNACPYTPAEGHSFQLDFPRLMARAQAQQARERGVPLRERLLGRPDLLARLARPLPGFERLANWGNQLGWVRGILERVLGIHRRKLLPTFAAQTFQAWFDRQQRAAASHSTEAGASDERSTPAETAAPSAAAAASRSLDNGRVLLFPTCFVNYNQPQIGKDALTVLQRNGVQVHCDYRRCCGMPALDSGDVPAAQRLARENVAQLLPYAERGERILVINPTCSLMLRQEYPALIGGEAAKAVAQAVRDPCEFLNELRRSGRAALDFRSTPGAVRYHVPCHLRAQNIGFRSRDMMRAIPHAQVQLVTECCGHDGTWAMKREYFDLSLKAGQKAFDAMRSDPSAAEAAPVLVTDCPLAAVQFTQVLGERPLHPLQILARAYREDGFPQRLPGSPSEARPAR